MNVVELIEELHRNYLRDVSDAGFGGQRERLLDWLDWLDAQPSEVREAALDDLARRLATGFARRDFDFMFCGGVVNILWPNVAVAAPPLPEVFYAVFEAFDAGEYDRGDGKDPVEAYTRPTIEALLEEWGRR